MSKNKTKNGRKCIIYMDKTSKNSNKRQVPLTVMNDSPKAYHLISIRKIKKDHYCCKF